MINHKEFVFLANKIKPRLEDQSLQRDFMNEIRNVFDRDSEVLSDIGLSSKPSISSTPFFKLTGLTETEIVNAMKKANLKNFNPVFLNNPFFINATLIIRHYTITNNKRMVEISKLATTVRIYAMLHRKYFPVGYAKKEVMDYTINNLSNKFDIKRLGSLQAALQKIGDANHENYENSFTNDSDDEIFRYIEGLRTRLNAFVQKIANEFTYNYKHKLYINTDMTAMKDEEGEEDFNYDRKSDSSAIEGATSSFVIWNSINSLDEKGLLIASNLSGSITTNSLKAIINNFKGDDSDRVREVISAIFTITMLHQKDNDLKAVCNIKFIPFVVSVYGKSNSVDENVGKIKDNLDYLLTKYSPLYTNTSREATKIAYKKALLIYFSYLIQKQRCG